MMEGWGFAYLLFRRHPAALLSAGTVSARIRWVIEFRRSSFCIQLASPCST